MLLQHVSYSQIFIYNVFNIFLTVPLPSNAFTWEVNFYPINDNKGVGILVPMQAKYLKNSGYK